MRVKKLIAIFILLSIMGVTACSFQTKEKITTKEDGIENSNIKISDYLYPAYTSENGVQKWGLINKEGQFVMQPTYDCIEDFHENGLAKVKIYEKNEENELVTEKIGLIDRKGNLIVEPKYLSMEEFAEGLITCQVHEKYKYIVLNAQGEVVFETPYRLYEFSEGLVKFRTEINDKDLYGYMNKEGKVVIEPQFEEAEDFHDGIAKVKTKDGQEIGIDKSGKEVTISARLLDAEKFIDGVAIINCGDYYEPKVGLINQKGEFVILPEYEEITSLGEGNYAVCKDAEGFSTQYSKKAIFNKKGQQITGFNYYNISSFHDGYAAVCDGESTYFIDQKGQEVAWFPKLAESGELKIDGEVVKLKFEEELKYYSKDGALVWQPNVIYKLDNNLEIKEVIYRPNWCTLIYYPEIIKHPNNKTQDIINKELKKIFVEESKGAEKDEEGFYETIDECFTVGKNKDLLIICNTGYYYPLGAAHGTPTKRYFFINLQNGNYYELKDLFKKDSKYLKKIGSIIGKLIAKEQKEENSELYGAEFEGFSEEPNFIISKNALQIYFYPYEIAPYSAGFPTFDIPYEEIADIIDMEGEFWNSFDKEMSMQ